MDDVDAVQAQAARTMLASGDWVTARLDGVAYLEKAPLNYWMMAVAYKIFGVHDWAARLPHALAVVLLCWVTYRFGRWAFGETAGLFAGLALSTSVGLFLFTRVLIPDAVLTLAITGAIWAWLRLLEPDEQHPLRWSFTLGLCLGAGLLLKGLIAAVFPIMAALAYMAVTRRLFSPAAWRRLHLGLAIPVALAIAVPWYVLATLRNPPYFAFSLHSGPGEYRGFFWFYFFNEHLLRFLGMRYPRDYDTVPQVVVLGSESALDFSLVVLPDGRADPRLQDHLTSIQNQTNGSVLDWNGDVIFHLLDHPGILFDAYLSGTGAPGGIGSSQRQPLGAHRDTRAAGRVYDLVCCAFHPAVTRLACPSARRHLSGIDSTSGTLYSFARPYLGLDAQRLRLLEIAAGTCGSCFRRDRNCLGTFEKKCAPNSSGHSRRHDCFFSGCPDCADSF